MSHIPTENKMHSNNKLLRLTCLLKKKKKQPYWQHVLKNILNMAEPGCAIMYPQVTSWPPVTYLLSSEIPHEP